jgi:hypothetical protein
MKKIISCSRRTDIPAFYSKWLINRVRAGYCTVVNPFNANQVSHVSLAPEDVEVFVFWTRNAAPLLDHLAEMDNRGYKYYFQYTVLGYPEEIDPFSPRLSEAVKTFIELSKLIGKEKVIWRYDPVLYSSLTDPEWHKRQFKLIAEKLEGYFERCVISIIDPYRKTTSRMSKETSLSFNLPEDAFVPEAYIPLMAFMGETAKKADFEIQTCAEGEDLSQYGITHGKCIDDELIARITARPLHPKKDASQRKACGCVLSKDIGANNTCVYGCKYCYATSNLELARKNMKEHAPLSPSLTGWKDKEPLKSGIKTIHGDLFDDSV